MRKRTGLALEGLLEEVPGGERAADGKAVCAALQGVAGVGGRLASRIGSLSVPHSQLVQWVGRGMASH